MENLEQVENTMEILAKNTIKDTAAEATVMGAMEAMVVTVEVTEVVNDTTLDQLTMEGVELALDYLGKFQM